MRFMGQIPAVVAILFTLSACMPSAPFPPSPNPTTSTTRTNVPSSSPSQIPTASQTASPLPSATHTQTATATFTSTATAIPPPTQTPTEEPTEKPTAKPKRTRTATAILRVPTVPDLGELIRGPVYLESVLVSVTTSEPATAVLHVTGNLPTPCNKLKITISGPDSHNLFAAEIYSLSWSNRTCIQVLAPFDYEVILASVLPPGDYSLAVNGGEPLPFSIPLLE